jgi:hypothetical protein
MKGEGFWHAMMMMSEHLRLMFGDTWTCCFLLHLFRWDDGCIALLGERASFDDLKRRMGLVVGWDECWAATQDKLRLGGAKMWIGVVELLHSKEGLMHG